jgi:Gluconate 2-dehydrogenase subunit 3
MATRERGGPTEHGTPPKMRRRALLRAMTAAMAVAGASAVAFVRTRDYAPPAGSRLVALSAWQFVVVQHASRRIVAPDPTARAEVEIPTADDLGVAQFVDAWLARMPRRLRRDFGRFLAFVEHMAPLGIGSITRFTHLGALDQDRLLASLQASSNDLLRAGFDGLRSLVFLGYYQDPRTWRLIGYDGPLVGRPEAGWR